MKRKTRQQSLVAEINITPFTDVILVLLVIFMITTPLISQSSIKVNLPEASNINPIGKTSQAYITITNEGTIYLGSDLITRKELKEKIKALKKENSNLGVVLRSDKLVRFKDVVSLLDIFTELEIKNLDIAAVSDK